MTMPWEASAAKLAGLLKLRDDVEALAREHDKAASVLAGLDTRRSALHEQYAKRLRAMLPTV